MVLALACLLAHLAVLSDNHKFSGLQFLKKWKPLSLIPHLPYTVAGPFSKENERLNANIPYTQCTRKSLLIPKWFVFSVFF